MTSALTISLAPSGNILLEIPSVLAEGRSHTVEIPFSLAGLSLLKRTLQRRAEAQKSKDLGIGSQASPVASDIQKYLADRAREERAAAGQIVKTLEERYALENIELEL